jgi:hypothetical protein
MHTTINTLAEIGTWFGAFSLLGKIALGLFVAWCVAAVIITALLWIAAKTGAGRGSDEAEDEARYGRMR